MRRTHRASIFLKPWGCQLFAVKRLTYPCCKFNLSNQPILQKNMPLDTMNKPVPGDHNVSEGIFILDLNRSYVMEVLRRVVDEVSEAVDTHFFGRELRRALRLEAELALPPQERTIQRDVTRDAWRGDTRCTRDGTWACRCTIGLNRNYTDIQFLHERLLHFRNLLL